MAGEQHHWVGVREPGARTLGTKKHPPISGLPGGFERDISVPEDGQVAGRDSDLNGHLTSAFTQS